MVTMPLAVRSEYYRGLLVLSRRDRIIDDREREFLVRIGVILDFDRRFCEAAIDALLSNPHVTGKPVVFSDKAVIECFFRDAIRVAHSDGYIHPLERHWLKIAALANGKPKQWIDATIRDVCKSKGKQDPALPLEIQKYL